MKEILIKSFFNGVLCILFLIMACFMLIKGDNIGAMYQLALSILNAVLVVLIAVAETFDRQKEIINKLDELSNKAEQ